MTATTEQSSPAESSQSRQGPVRPLDTACSTGSEHSYSQQPVSACTTEHASQLPESIAHLEGRSFDTDWYRRQCDAELVVQGVSLPVHSNIISMWSVVLTHCIAATAGGTSLQRKSISLQDNLQPLQDLLFLVYSFASSARTQDVWLLLEKSRQRLKDVMILADKYDMPMLLKHIDELLAKQASRDHSRLWVSTAEAISWALLASRLRMPKFREACESYITRAASADELAAAAKVLSHDSVLRILGRLLGSMQFPMGHSHQYDREQQLKGLRLCAEAQHHHHT